MSRQSNICCAGKLFTLSRSSMKGGPCRKVLLAPAVRRITSPFPVSPGKNDLRTGKGSFLALRESCPNSAFRTSCRLANRNDRTPFARGRLDRPRLATVNDVGSPGDEGCRRGAEPGGKRGAFFGRAEAVLRYFCLEHGFDGVFAAREMALPGAAGKVDVAGADRVDANA